MLLIRLPFKSWGCFPDIALKKESGDPSFKKSFRFSAKFLLDTRTLILLMFEKTFPLHPIIWIPD